MGPAVARGDQYACQYKSTAASMSCFFNTKCIGTFVGTFIAAVSRMPRALPVFFVFLGVLLCSCNPPTGGDARGSSKFDGVSSNPQWSLHYSWAGASVFSHLVQPSPVEQFTKRCESEGPWRVVRLELRIPLLGNVRSRIDVVTAAVHVQNKTVLPESVILENPEGCDLHESTTEPEESFVERASEKFIAALEKQGWLTLAPRELEPDLMQGAVQGKVDEFVAALEDDRGVTGTTSGEDPRMHTGLGPFHGCNGDGYTWYLGVKHQDKSGQWVESGFATWLDETGRVIGLKTPGKECDVLKLHGKNRDETIGDFEEKLAEFQRSLWRNGYLTDDDNASIEDGVKRVVEEEKSIPPPLRFKAGPLRRLSHTLAILADTEQGALETVVNEINRTYFAPYGERLTFIERGNRETNKAFMVKSTFAPIRCISPGEGVNRFAYGIDVVFADITTKGIRVLGTNFGMRLGSEGYPSGVMSEGGLSRGEECYNFVENDALESKTSCATFVAKKVFQTVQDSLTELGYKKSKERSEFEQTVAETYYRFSGSLCPTLPLW